MATIRFPSLYTDVAFAIAPGQILFDRFLLVWMAAIVSIVQCKFLQCCKVTLDAIKPRGIRRRPVELNIVRGRVRLHLRFVMVGRVIKYYVQRFFSRVPLPQPFQKCQKCRPVLLRRKRSDQRIPFQIIGSKHVSHTAVAIVRCPQTLHLSRLGIMPAVPRQQIQRSELVDTDATTALGTLGIQPLNPPVLRPKLGILGVFPSLRVPPSDFAATQNLPQHLQRDRGHDLLSNQILPQFRKRPDAHANELFWWRQGDLANLLDDFGRKLPRAGRPAKARPPRNSFAAAAIEAVNNRSDPGRRAAALFGNPGVGAAAARQQNNSRMKPVDSIGQLMFHRSERPALIGSKRPCFYRVHFRFSTLAQLPHAACGEPIYNISNDGASPCLIRTYEFFKKRETVLLETALVAHYFVSLPEGPIMLIPVPTAVLRPLKRSPTICCHAACSLSFRRKCVHGKARRTLA